MKRHLSNILSLTNAALWNCVGDSKLWPRPGLSTHLSFYLIIYYWLCSHVTRFIFCPLWRSLHISCRFILDLISLEKLPQKKTNANEMGLKKKVSVKKPDGWTFDPLLQRCSRVERNSARHRWTATNGKSSLRSTCGDMFLQLEMARTGRDKHICCSVVLHQIAFISDWTENKMNRSRRGVTSSARISRAAEVSAGDF